MLHIFVFNVARPAFNNTHAKIGPGPVILHITRSHKRNKDVTRRVFESPKAPNAFGGRLRPDSLGEGRGCLLVI